MESGKHIEAIRTDMEYIKPFARVIREITDTIREKSKEHSVEGEEIDNIISDLESDLIKYIKLHQQNEESGKNILDLTKEKVLKEGDRLFEFYIEKDIQVLQEKYAVTDLENFLRDLIPTSFGPTRSK
ncbi:hypothetical protein COB18_01410 [Candidatus Kaiserbacteria bacterium]|nr:MAG: hypothetical protein COB18_01410 [Candidatus Kaiserbacteria bacterium]